MAVGLEETCEIAPIDGVRIGTAELGGRAVPRPDLTVFELAAGSRCAAVFTRNAFQAAPVVVARANLSGTTPRFLVVNAGNANAGTGARGVEDAEACCELIAAAMGCPPQAVLPFSTGVIGEYLDVERFRRGVPAALAALERDAWGEAARAIMTTDTAAKGISRTFETGGRRCTVSGITKGSGMIRPDMATMLAFIATDAAIGQDALSACLRAAVDASFNRITIDGDTSTNDACVLAATGASGAPEITHAAGPGYDALRAAVTEVARWLAQAIVRDGEGATKFVTVSVERGASASECLDVAYTVAHSPLVKTALFASDANWGRILAAVGRAGLAGLDLDRVQIFVGDVCIVRGGQRAHEYREEDGARVFAAEEISIRVVLGRGDHGETVWTTDLSHEYVRINAEYRS